MSEPHSLSMSTSKAVFDIVASTYDDLFTRSVIGRAQRNQVWERLQTAFHPGERILELNCGTGEDARFLAQRGVSVFACDASAVMIEIAKARKELEPGAGKVEYRQLANEDLSPLMGQGLFDGAFSNFSGLNCLADLQPVASSLSQLVKPGGRVVVCLWSRLCVTELVWFLSHGQIRKAFRRFSGKATARLGGLTMEVSYPAVRSIRQAFAPWFRLESRKAIGLFVPPSYVEPWAQNHDGAVVWLQKMDRWFSAWPGLRDAGDHVLLEFVRCSL